MEFAGVRIKTASTKRAIDKWRGRARAQVVRSQYWGMYVATLLLGSSRRGKILLIPILVIALLFNFAAIEFIALILVGFFTAKLQCYRFVNSIAKRTPFSV